MPIALVVTIDLPGVEGRIDHLAVDVETQRLCVAQQAAIRAYDVR